MRTTYEKFLAQKERMKIESGFHVDLNDLNSKLFPFQKYAVQLALKKGKFALIEDCGMGKTFQQTEWAWQVYKHTGRPVLILAPLCVSMQTIEQMKEFGYKIREYDGSDFPIQITNYEQLKNIDTSIFAGVVLDESSILKNYEGKMKNLIMEKFCKTPYKLACTATPAPNDPMEYGNHSEFLDVMTRNEMLAMYFVHDSSDTSKWRIKGHAVGKFYDFMAEWSIMISKPSDIGFEDTGYVLPELNIITEQITTPKKNNGQFWNDTAVSATTFNQELRTTKDYRLRYAADFANSHPEESIIIWVKHNDEGKALKKMIPDSVEVSGSDKKEFKEKALFDFASGKYKVLITKTEIASFGMNFQNCHEQIFISPDFSFEKLYQAIRRSYRFGQTKEVNIRLAVTDTMQNVKDAIDRKQEQFEEMQKHMREAMKRKMSNREITINENVITERNEYYTLQCGDSFKLIKEIGTETIGGGMFSPPFSSLFTYSNKINDLSNSKTLFEFYRHFKFIIPELYRILKPGRMYGIHLTQLTTGIAKDGYFSIQDFRGDIIRLFKKSGFIHHGEVTIWKDPELAAVRTNNHQLLHKTTKRDSTICRPGLADYLVIMRKPGINAEPVTHEKQGIPFDEWCQIASPVWMDVRESDTLRYRDARENEDERHITPTQLSIFKRFNTLYTNPGDVLYDPFAGIGSSVYINTLMKRKSIAHELKSSYFQLLKQNSKIAYDEVTKVQELFV